MSNPGAIVPTAFQIILVAVIIILASRTCPLVRFLCMRRWIVVVSLPPLLSLPLPHSLVPLLTTLYPLASVMTVISVLCRPLLTKPLTTWSQIHHLPSQVPLFTWGSLDGPTCLSFINEVYDVVVQWRLN